MKLSSKFIVLGLLAMSVTNCKSSNLKDSSSETFAAQGGSGWSGSAGSTLVDDATQSNGNGTYKMGVRNPGINGIACRKFSGKAGVNFEAGKAWVFYVAPSDGFFNQTCKKNPYGGEPSCEEIADHCGKRIEISCNDPVNCNRPGEKSLFSKMVEGFRDTKNQNSMDSFNDLKKILRTTYQQKFPNDESLKNVQTPKSIVLVINDFCPKLHSQNGGHCAGPHLDVSNAAYLLYGKPNAQGYISPNVNLNYTFHNSKSVEIGPKW